MIHICFLCGIFLIFSLALYEKYWNHLLCGTHLKNYINMLITIKTRLPWFTYILIKFLNTNNLSWWINHSLVWKRRGHSLANIIYHEGLAKRYKDGLAIRYKGCWNINKVFCFRDIIWSLELCKSGISMH